MTTPTIHHERARAATRRALAGMVLVMVLVGAALGAAPTSARAAVLATPAIDHTSRDSVRAAYQTVLAPTLTVPTGWTGAVSGCVAGAPSAAAQDATLQAVNYFRAMADLPAVAFDAALSAKAQAAALMMHAKNGLSHEPTSAWPCFTPDGQAAAGASNLYLGQSGAAAIAGYMVDPGAGNNVAGHRRWILYPPRTTMGSGSTSNANALYIFGTDAARPATSWVAWPTPGYFPAQIEPGGRWSLSANEAGTDFSKATVTVTTGGAALPVTVQTVVNGYGDNTLVWQVDTGFTLGQADRVFHVAVGNIVRGGAKVTREYDVTLFDVGMGAPAIPPPPGVGSTTPAPPATIEALRPARLMDTRPGSPTADGAMSGIGPLGARSMRTLKVTGRGGVPEGARAVAVNLTATNATAATYLTVYPGDAAKPTASNVNVVPGQTVANLVVVPVAADGTITIFNNAGQVDLVLDVQAWYPVGAVHALTPARLADTRPGEPTADGQLAGVGAVGGGRTLTIAVAGRGGVPAGASAVVLNVTATGATADTFVTAYPGGLGRPTASTVNVGPGRTVANLVTVPVGGDGTVAVFVNAGAVHLVVDVQAWYGAGEIGAVPPARLLDTRPGAPTVDGVATGAGPVLGGRTVAVPVRGRGNVPAGAGAVVVNVTATGATADTYLTVYPTGGERPTASNVNLGAGQTVPNLVTVPIGADGTITVYSNAGAVHVVVDVQAYFPA